MTDEFSKDTIKKFGPRGAEFYERTEQTTDLDALSSRVEETALPFCTCGRQLAGTGDVYRCCDCEVICCEHCHVALSRWHYCPTCARRRFELDKRTFLALVFLDRDLLTLDDLVDVVAHEGEVLEVAVDAATDVVVGNQYVDADGGLSPAGKEAMAVGRQLYGDDGDVTTVLEQLRLRDVVARGD